MANRQILLKSRPVGEPTPANFECVDRPVPAPAAGGALVRTIYLSVDPYMRGRMNAGKSYADPVNIGDVMCGGTVGQVVESLDPTFKPGDLVLGDGGWQEFAALDGSRLRKLDANAAPISYTLGALGMPGMTAYVGMIDIGQPKAGETVVVSAAAGAVGSVAGQIAKLKGCRVVGIAGSDEKCRYVVESLGFDACINYKTEPLLGRLRKHCPGGIDVYFDSVAGSTLETILRLINVGARIPLIGLISLYNATELTPGPNLFPLLVRRAMIKGMIVSDHANRQPAFLADMTAWIRDGKVKVRETIVNGLENAPAAFIGLFRGENTGKMLVKVSREA
ncbi:MAG: NADP-dependent oxidoreductase [Phycisphaerae bacterium]|nr:NADP-dependent oxidoreductase [Phycisphaerae bacterium]